MIKLEKQPEPVYLSQHKVQWTNELMSFHNNQQKIPLHIQNRYNHDDIKYVLRKETNGGKCMYCECFIKAVAPEHIEHYRPKRKYPQLTFDWNNLGLSCPTCNLNKGDTFDESCTFINPYIDLPDAHFIFIGTMIFHKPNDERANLTELCLDLNRSELMEARKERIDAISSMIDKFKSQRNPTLKAILKTEIIKEIAKDKPYSMCVKSVYKILIKS